MIYLDLNKKFCS